MSWRNGRKGWGRPNHGKPNSAWVSKGGGDSATSTSTSTSSSAAERNPGLVTSTRTDDDDWGCFAEKEREPYVYQPAWAKEFPHLLTNPPKHVIPPSEWWKLSQSSPSDDEEEERLSGGSNAVNKKMPSATLTARRPSFPVIKPVRLAVGELSDPLSDRSAWSSKVPDKFQTSETQERFASAVRHLAGEEDRESENKVEIPYSVDLNKYTPKYSRKGGIDYKSFIPPLPSQEDIDKVKEEAKAAAGFVEICAKEIEAVTEELEHHSEHQEANEVETELALPLSDISKDPETQDQADNQADTENILVCESPSSDIDRAMPLTMQDICPPLKMEVPFKGRMLGFVEGGYVLIRFCDLKTKAQFQNLLQTVWDYFGSQEKLSDVVIPEDQITENILVFGFLPPESRGAGNYSRVKIVKTNPSERIALCKDMDTWEYANITYKNLYFMPPTFLDTPFLMHHCRLKGLEFWSEGRVMQEMAHLLPSMAEDVTITHYETDEDGIPLIEALVKISKSSKNRAQGMNPSDETPNLADILSRSIAGFTRIPRQFVKGSLVDRGHISNVDKEGRAWLSLHSALASRLVTIGENPKRIKTSVEFNPTLGTRTALTDFEFAFIQLKERRFLAHFLDDRGHFRVEIDEFKKGDKEVKVRYLDFGNTEVIPVTDVYPSDLFDPLINKIAPQVVQGYLNGITAIRDPDEFFDHITIKQTQRITISGFQPPNAAVLFDVHTQFKTPTGSSEVDGTHSAEKPEREWTYVNQYIVDKGIATPHPEGVIPFRRVGGEEENTKNILHMRQLSMTDPTAKQRSDCLKASERNRYVTSCRIEQEDDGRYAYLSIKPKKIKDRLVRPSGLESMRESEEEEFEEEEEE